MPDIDRPNVAWHNIVDEKVRDPYVNQVMKMYGDAVQERNKLRKQLYETHRFIQKNCSSEILKQLLEETYGKN